MKFLKINTLFSILLFCLCSISCSRKSTSSLSQHKEEVRAAQNRMEQQQQVVRQVEKLMNEKAKARLKESEAFLLKGNIPSPCACGSGEEHTHFPTRLLSQEKLSKIQGTPLGPLVLLSHEFTLLPNQEVHFQLRIANLQQKMYSGTLQINAIQPDGSPLEIPLLPQFQNSSSPLLQNKAPQWKVFKKIKIFHLHPAYEIQIPLKFYPGNYLYYDWAQVLEAFRQKQYRFEFIEWTEEDPSLVPHDESSTHSHSK